MSHIGDLIRQHCPDGVPYKTLDEVGSFTRGSGLQKKDFTETGFPCIHYGQIYTHYGISATQTKSFIDPAQAARLHRAQPGDLIIATTSENDEDVCKAVAWLGDGEVAVSNDACFYHHELDAKYVSYWIQSTDFQRQKDQWITGTKVRRVSVRNLERALIPVPPLPVQGEIVRILDSFTNLEAELEAELEARQRQYQHYSERLLNDVDSSSIVRLGDIATISRGASPRPISKYITGSPDGIPWIRIGDVPEGGKYVTHTAQRITQDGASKSRRVRPGDFVLSNSMSFGRPYISKINGCIHDGWLSIIGFDPYISSDYLYYLLRSSTTQSEFARRAGAGTVKNLNAEIVRSIQVSVPNTQRQQEVVRSLNCFSAMLSDLSSGLPAEIAARRQQYEHYRDRLLTFKELPA